MKQPDNLVELLAKGEIPPIDPVGTNFQQARKQARGIILTNMVDLQPALIALITKIQEQSKSIEMFEYTQKWRKRRP